MAQTKSEKLPDNIVPTINNNENNPSKENNQLQREGKADKSAGRGFQRNLNQGRGSQRRGRWQNRNQNSFPNEVDGIDGNVYKDTFSDTPRSANNSNFQHFGTTRTPEDRFLERLQSIGGPTYNLDTIDASEKKFSGRNRLYFGNLSKNTTDAELKELLKPFGETSEVFLNKEKCFGFIRVDYQANTIKAKNELDGTTFKGNVIKVRFSPIGSCIKVKNLTPWVTNELLHYAFSIFGEIDRCFVIADDRGKSNGEGIVEYMRKSSALNALQRCNEGCFFLTSSLRPVIVESYDPVDLFDTYSEKSIFKKSQQYYQARDIGPRFARPGSFEYEYGTQWKQLHDQYKKKCLSLQQELEMEQNKLEARMEFVKFENETKMLREQLRAREKDYERQKREYEECERMLEKQRRLNENHSLLQDGHLASHSQSSLFIQAQQLSNMLTQQEQAFNSTKRDADYAGQNEVEQQQPLLGSQSYSTERNYSFDGQRESNSRVSSEKDALAIWNLSTTDYNRKRRRM